MKTIGGLGALREMYVNKEMERLTRCVVTGRAGAPATVTFETPSGKRIALRVYIARNVKTGRSVSNVPNIPDGSRIVGIHRSKHAGRVVGIWSENPRTVITRTA